MINAVIIAISVLIIVSKFADCLSTVIIAKKRNIGFTGEKNPLARYLMVKFGFQVTIWSVFIFTVLLSAVSAYYVVIRQDVYYSIVYIFLGLVISLLQFDVARANSTGKYSFFTVFLSRVYRS